MELCKNGDPHGNSWWGIKWGPKGLEEQKQLDSLPPLPGATWSLISVLVYPSLSFSLLTFTAQTGILLVLNFSLHVALLVSVLVHTYSDVVAPLPTASNHSLWVLVAFLVSKNIMANPPFWKTCACISQTLVAKERR